MLYRYFLLMSTTLLCATAVHAQTSGTATTAVTAKANIPGQKVLKLYPNDAKTYVNIYVDLPAAESFKISVYDYNFKSWIKEIPVDVRKNYQYTLDVSQLPNGKYKILLKTATMQREEDFTVAH